MTHRLPPAPFGRRLLVRTVLLWVCFRCAAVVGGNELLALLADLEGTARPGLPLGSLVLGLALAALVSGVVLAEMVRRSELLFLGNLGWSPRRLAATTFVICLGLEAFLQATLGW